MPGKRTLPGTTLEVTNDALDTAFDILKPIFAVTKGLMLSQIKDLTGLEMSTLQNWVKRGWVTKPTGKKYNEEQVARILIISMLRDSMQMEKIVNVLHYINGDIEDESDNIINESELYAYLVKIIFTLDKAFNRDTIEQAVDAAMEDYTYTGPMPNSRQRLKTALLIMTLAYVASAYKQMADAEYGKVGEEIW